MTAPSVIYIVVLLCFVALLLAAATSDVKNLTIPNRISAAIILLYPAHALSSPVTLDWAADLVVGAGFLVVGFGLFVWGRFGAGDVKLATGAALWSGIAFGAHFLAVMGVVGGLIATTMLVRQFLNKPVTAEGADIDRTTANRRQPMPYGVAIAAGGIYVALIKILGA